MAFKQAKLDCGEETEEGQQTERENWDGLPPEVLNMILNHLPVADLLSSSVVSKNWKKASRDVLKRNKECYAHIKNFRRDVQSLNDMIVSTDLMQMINGLHIQISPKNNPRKAAPSSSWRKDSYSQLKSKETRRRWEKAKLKLQAVLCGQWRYLKLDVGNYWKEILSVDDALILREVVSATSESLQKLVVTRDVDCSFMSWCVKEFSKLKVLHAEERDTVGRGSYLEQFVLKFAPNLEEITGAKLLVYVHSPGNPFMLKRMKSIRIFPDVVIPRAGLMEGFRNVSGLYRLSIRLYHCRNSDDLSILLSMVLKSMNTLGDLSMCIVEFYKLFKTSDELKFPNLRRLSLYTHNRTPIENEISALKRLNLPKLCPNLKHMALLLYECNDDYEEEEEIPFEGPYRVDQSNLPVQLEYQCRGLTQKYCHEHLEFLSQIYPKMNKVRVMTWRPGDNPQMNSIFLDLHSLEYLEINVSFGLGSIYDPDVAIAAFLSGINFVEAKFLFSGTRRKNAKLNPYIVPIRPSLFNAKNLKKVKITGESGYLGAIAKHSWVIKVTENLPVRHARKLIVKFEGTEGVYEKLNHLRILRTLLGAQVKEN